MRRTSCLVLPTAMGMGFLSGFFLSGCLVPEESTTSPTTTTDSTTDSTSETETTTDTGTESTSGTTSDTETTSTTTTTTTTTVDTSCQGQPTAENTIEKCGIFARADADPALADGTREHPYPTLQKAIDEASAAGKRVFACTVAPFEESVVVDARLEIWGGVDCTDDWSYLATARTVLTGPVEQRAMTLSVNAGGSRIVSLFIEAPDAVSPGGSSIPVMADKGDKETTFWRCDLVAGNGKDGENGAPPSGAAAGGDDATLPGVAGGPTSACFGGSVNGGTAGLSTCDDGQSIGGNGGNGGAVPSGAGQAGQNGSPAPSPNPLLFGEGGDGQSAAFLCESGSSGADGALGFHGLGAAGKGKATIDGITPVNGFPGSPGGRGQGGGGGGGAKAGAFCTGALLPGVGASGGGGGSGGCGGKGGNPGLAGGSSIGLISLGSDIRMLESTVTTGNGGKGGDGAAGQSGGSGGQGAPGGAASGFGSSSVGCSGGDGGNGGPGGSGGGGRGGHSIGIVYFLPFGPAWEDSSWFIGTQGPGGAGGPGNVNTGKGDNGAKDAQRNFAN